MRYSILLKTIYRFIENTTLVSFDIKFIRGDRNNVGMAKLAKPVDVFVLEPDKLDIRRH